MYMWLVLQIIVFYIMVAYGISLWAAYVCWESDREEKHIKAAMKKYAETLLKKNQDIMVYQGGKKKKKQQEEEEDEDEED